MIFSPAILASVPRKMLTNAAGTNGSFCTSGFLGGLNRKVMLKLLFMFNVLKILMFSPYCRPPIVDNIIKPECCLDYSIPEAFVCIGHSKQYDREELALSFFQVVIRGKVFFHHIRVLNRKEFEDVDCFHLQIYWKDIISLKRKVIISLFG